MCPFALNFSASRFHGSWWKQINFLNETPEKHPTAQIRIQLYWIIVCCEALLDLFPWSMRKSTHQSEQIKRNEIGNRHSKLNEVIDFIQLGNFDGFEWELLFSHTHTTHDKHSKLVAFRLRVRALIGVNAANGNLFIGIWRGRHFRILMSFSHPRRIPNILILWKCVSVFEPLSRCVNVSSVPSGEYDVRLGIQLHASILTDMTQMVRQPLLVVRRMAD